MLSLSDMLTGWLLPLMTTARVRLPGATFLKIIPFTCSYKIPTGWWIPLHTSIVPFSTGILATERKVHLCILSADGIRNQ
jgi:hypothetical protein